MRYLAGDKYLRDDVTHGGRVDASGAGLCVKSNFLRSGRNFCKQRKIRCDVSIFAI